MTGPKRVAIIGAGASGLTGIKICLDEGLTPVCYERRDDIGGLWNFTQEAVENQACVMKSTVINTSKEMMCYSDFPIPQDYPVFMHNTKVMDYFRLYCERFDLLRHIHFQTEILRLSKSSDFTQTGQWILEIKNIKTGETKTEVFDGVLVCSGHHAEKYQPKFPGAENFKGKTIHTHDYKYHVGYEDKRVVVIGIGNSGGDVAVELGRVAIQVYLSTRRGSWVINRIADNGFPADMIGVTRLFQGVEQVLPGLYNAMAEKQLNFRFDHARYGLKPKHRFNGQHPMVNDDLPNRIACGSVVIKSNIHRITETGVEFDDATSVEDIDVIFFATGYKFGFPYIDEGIIDVKDNKVDLYKWVFPPDLEQPTLAVIGCIQPWGAIMPISEMQCRWAAGVFKKCLKLPSQEEMRIDVQRKHQEMSSRYYGSHRHTIQVDFISYMDEMAECVGCKPSLWSTFTTDPKLALQILVGPCTPYQYRLTGPSAWAGARQAIMTQWDRTVTATQTRQVTRSQTMDRKHLLHILAIILFAIIVKVVLF